MADTNLTVRLFGDSKHLRTELGRASTAMYAAGGAASRLGTVMRSAFRPLTALVAANAIAVRQMSKFILQSVQTYVEFNDTLARTAAIIGTNDQQFQALSGEIQRLGRTTRFTATQVGEAANAMAIAGVSAEEMVTDKALENLVKFGIAGGVDIQTATNIAIAGVKAFGMEMDQLGAVTDVLTRTFTRSNVSIVSLGEGMKFAAPVAHSAGIAIEETAAAIGALGNAGLRGTVAGTGLRMSINKLLKPTFDAQRAMNDLGLTVQRLSPVGHAANNMLKGVTAQLDRTKAAAGQLSNEMKMLNDEMTDLSIEQQQNTLAIEQIRSRAARMNRQLTQDEQETIARLTKANDALRVSEMELDLQRAVTRRELDRTTAAEKALAEQSRDLKRTVEQQTTGVTSLGDVLDQLANSGATTTQVLEIFGVRGGTAIASLLTQRDAFHELVKENENAQNATGAYVAALKDQESGQGSSKEALLEFKSAMEGLAINVGLPFVNMLVKVTQVLKDKLEPMMKTHEKLFAALAREVGFAFKAIAALAINALPDILHLMRALVPVVIIVAGVFRLLIAIVRPFAQIIAGVFNIVMSVVKALVAAVQLAKALFTGDFDAAKSSIKEAGSLAGRGVQDLLVGGTVAVAAAMTGGLAAGAAPAAMTAGAFAAGAGASVVGGNALFQGVGNRRNMALGGIVTGPTQALIGESGPEMVVPLGRGKEEQRGRLMERSGMGGVNVSVGDIVINGGSDPHSTAEMVRTVVHNELPTAIRQALLRGARGVI